MPRKQSTSSSSDSSDSKNQSENENDASKDSNSPTSFNKALQEEKKKASLSKIRQSLGGNLVKKIQEQRLQDFYSNEEHASNTKKML